MSLTTQESGNESTPNSAEQKSQTSPEASQSQSQSSNANAAQADNTWDAESLEVSFGLPPGSLRDVKDEASALEAVRTMTDKLLTAGLGFAEPTTETSAETKPATKPATKAETKPSGNAELDALRAEVEALKARDQEREAKLIEQQNKQNTAMLRQRITTKIDSWASPKYGVTGTRNFKQAQAVKEFEEVLLPNFVAGRRASGLSLDAASLEAYMEQVRVFQDENYKPAKKGAAKDAALGTPGASKPPAGSDAPRTIHHALMGNRS